jgi:hypothetical protein
MTHDPARSALVRYLAHCIRAEMRARQLLEVREARTRAAKQQIRDYDQQQVKTADQMLIDGRTAKRRNNVRRRAA